MTDAATATLDSPPAACQSRRDWSRGEILDLFALSFNDLLFQAHQVHRRHWDANSVQLSTLLSVKTGGCGEDCGYCAQSAHYRTGLKAEKPMARAAVRAAAEKAKAAGASRFCMSAAWRQLNDRDLPYLAGLIGEVKNLGLETCVTAGMVTKGQAEFLRDSGLDYYNHNIDTSPEYYGRIITTHGLGDRLATLNAVRTAGLKVCCGGIIGIGESREDRAGMLEILANLAPQPESVPINSLVPVRGTPLEDEPPLDRLELARTIAVARLLMPWSYVRLSAGRLAMSDEAQALCFFAGANSIFYGEKLLTTGNPERGEDQALFDKLGLQAETLRAHQD